MVHTCEVQMDLSELSQALTTLTIHEVIPLNFGSSPLKMCLKKEKKKLREAQDSDFGQVTPFLGSQIPHS